MDKKYKTMVHVVAGYPNLPASLKLARTIVRSGADILEIQIPFSEPVADGPTIVAACHAALEKGFKTRQIFNFCRQLRSSSAELVVMSYANPIIKIGIDVFCRRIKGAGVSGLIVPDLPFDSPEGRQLYKSCRHYDLNLIQVVSPSMDKSRLQSALNFSAGMVYSTSRQGTTGGAFRLSAGLKKLLAEIRKKSVLPLAVGFGISSPAEARRAGRFADIVVVGSAVIRLFSAYRGDQKYQKISELVKRLKK